MSIDIELQQRVIEYMQEYYTAPNKTEILPPSPDTLVKALDVLDTERLNGAIVDLIEKGLVFTVSFHNWLDFTDLGYKTFII